MVQKQTYVNSGDCQIRETENRLERRHKTTVAILLSCTGADEGLAGELW